MGALKARPLTLKQANALVADLHRHHKPVTGHRFSIGAFSGDTLVGVAIVGRPVARKTDQYLVAEVTRLCTNGHKNACSFLYASCARICKEMGFNSIQTFILDTETGTSLKASGWSQAHTTVPSKLNWNNRPGRREDQPTGPKTKWEKVLN